jgi:hypothetical protein
MPVRLHGYPYQKTACAEHLKFEKFMKVHYKTAGPLTLDITRSEKVYD